MYLYEYDNDASAYREYCEEYAERHPIYELGLLIGYSYPNGSIRYVRDDDETKLTHEYY